MRRSNVPSISTVPHVLVLALTLALAAAVRGQETAPPPEESFAYDDAHPAAGLWVGTLEIGGAPRYGVFRIAAEDDTENGPDDGGYRVVTTVAVILALGSDAVDVEVDGTRVAFTVKGQAAQIRLAGTVSADGQRLAGTVTDLAPDAPDLDTRFELKRTVPVLDLPGPMAFTGEAEIRGLMKLGMTIALAETPGGRWVGHVDVPAQMTHGFVLADLARDGDTFTAVLPGPVPAHLEVALSEDRRTLSGTLKQGGYVMVIDFPRHDGYVGSTLHRPQHPRPPYPYRVEEVTITHPDGHRLAGTLTVPDDAAHGEGPYPAAVLVSGSGAQDRDESLLGHKPFLVIADHLTRHGIAVLRYDDRGYAGSTGSMQDATSADLATDALAAVRFARDRNEVDGKRVGIIGHSEGGLIAPMVAGLEPDVAFLVLLAGPGVRGADLLVVQGEMIARAAGADEATIASNRQTQERIFDVLLGDDPPETQEASVRDILAAAPSLLDIADATDRSSVIDAQIAQLTSPWLRYFLSHDPQPALAAVRCPVLAMNGTLDLQVWHEQNLNAINAVIESAGGDVTIRRYEGLNHLFQPATTGGIDEYAAIETTIEPGVLIDMVDWIRLASGVSK